MDKSKEEVETEIGKPPFFSSWRNLYVFVLLFEIGLIAFFIWITQSFAA